MNEADSELAREAEWVLPQRAGREKAVAATKSFNLSLVALARLVAAWTEDTALAVALVLNGRTGWPRALECDWSGALGFLHAEQLSGAFVLARGPALAIAHEAALKLKETCYVHAEALSSAETARAVRRAGGRLSGAGVCPGGRGGRGHARAGGACDEGGRAGDDSVQRLCSRAWSSPLLVPVHPLLDRIVAITAFYPFAEVLARRRGIDPDRLRNLRKVTCTM